MGIEFSEHVKSECRYIKFLNLFGLVVLVNFTTDEMVICRFERLYIFLTILIKFLVLRVD